MDPGADQAMLVARIAELERVKSAAAAGQARAAMALDAARCAAEAAAGVPAATGATHRSSAPPLPGRRAKFDLSEIEYRVGLAITELSAA